MKDFAVIAGFGVIGFMAWILLRQGREEQDLYFEEVGMEPDFIDTLAVAANVTNYFPAAVNEETAQANTRAFLDAIAYAEGTANANGYRTMFGYRYFDSFADHPRQYFSFTDQAGRQLKSSAAGRYQIIVRTWDDLKAKLGLMDFSPESQDAAAIELIRQRGALNDVKAGRFEAAIAKCKNIWASLPGAGYDQPERSLADLKTAFINAGGTITA